MIEQNQIQISLYEDFTNDYYFDCLIVQLQLVMCCVNIIITTKTTIYLIILKYPTNNISKC